MAERLIDAVREFTHTILNPYDLEDLQAALESRGVIERARGS